MTNEVIAMLLAGGVGSRLNILAGKRAKPAIPFGGTYRIIDFTMSNIVHSEIDIIGVLTQYKPLSLMDHLDDGRPWDLFGRTRRVEILPPKTGEEMSDWYKGTSDAVYQNLAFIADFSPQYVLIVSGDHIYHMDYEKLLRFHKENQADATVCLINVPKIDAHNFGIAIPDRTHRIVDWEEKPTRPRSTYASMGVYMFTRTILDQILIESARKRGTDFARDVVPMLLNSHRVLGYEFNGYWRDVGTIDAYWNANMDLLRYGSGLDIEQWRIKTNMADRGEIGDRPSAYIGHHARIANSLIARGCVIEGTVINSVLSPGVRIGQDTIVRDSIIFHDTRIAQNADLTKIITDKDVVIENNVYVGTGKDHANKKYPKHLHTGITVIGKGAQVAASTKIGKNCIVTQDTTVQQNIPSGSTI
jgi:glucose-1-phosphate adenylyltransferase